MKRTGLYSIIFFSIIILFTFSCTPPNPNDPPDTDRINLANGTTPDDYQIDLYQINETSITDDALLINVSHSGGCEEHTFTLFAHNYFMESYPVQAGILMAHDANNDMCEAFLTKDIQFDLIPLKEAYQSAYPNSSPDDTIVLRIFDPQNPETPIIVDYALGSATTDPAEVGEQTSNKPRELNPDVADSDIESLSAGNTEFALSLYHQLRQNVDGNLFYSPYSISAALAMAYAGAEGTTEQEMAETMNFTIPEDKIHAGFNYLDLELQSRGEGASAADGGEFRLNIANAIWGQKDYPFLTDFLDVLAINYGAGSNIVDFLNDPEASRITINQWVADKTEDKIDELLKPGTISSDTRLVLTNAIYFNAAWQNQFEESFTHDASFFLIDDSEISVPMMHQTESMGYVQGESFQAVELPYDGRELSMIIIVPDSGEFDAVESSLTSEDIAAIISDIQYHMVDLYMPKWEYRLNFSVRQMLINLGMQEAFSDAADFSGITDPSRLFISDVVHEAYVKVNEAGTEAAAATAVIFNESSILNPLTVNINRPFIYLIRDIETETIVFAGRVLNPAQ